MRFQIAALAAGLVAIAATSAFAQQRLSRECRQEIRQLCGTDRSKMRACLRASYRELSDNCQTELRERIQQRRQGNTRPDPTAVTRLPPQKFDLFPYGQHERQAVDFYAPQSTAHGENPPLILFVHGGGWAIGNRTQSVHAKPAHFTEEGYAFASTGYRLVPASTVEDQARDIAAAIAMLRANAGELNFDADSIVLMGHSAGAHLAALVATDPQYTGTDMAAIRGVVLLDGAGYDVVANMAAARRQARRMYDNAFGADPVRQRALSPITHVGAPDASNWLILHVASRLKSRDQSNALAVSLRAAGAEAEAIAIADTNHMRLNRELGQDGDAATAKVDAFLERAFAD